MHAGNRRTKCPQCRNVISNCGIVAHEDGSVETAQSDGSASPSSSSSRASPSSYVSSLDFGEPTENAIIPRLENLWLQLARDQQEFLSNGRYRCCATGTRVWVLASNLAEALNIRGFTEAVLVRSLPMYSYGPNRERRPTYRNFLRTHPLQPDYDFDRPVFELYWDRDESRYYVSCLSNNGGQVGMENNCRCGADDRDADLCYQHWSQDTVTRVTLHLRSYDPTWPRGYPYEDTGAEPGEVSPPWLHAATELNALLANRIINVPDMTVHEFVWQCRNCWDFQQSPQFQVCTYVNQEGLWEYWVRAVTVGQRRRMFRADLDEVPSLYTL